MSRWGLVADARPTGRVGPQREVALVSRGSNRSREAGGSRRASVVKSLHNTVKVCCFLFLFFPMNNLRRAIVYVSHFLYNARRDKMCLPFALSCISV
jgi:hypothetical protein